MGFEEDMDDFTGIVLNIGDIDNQLKGLLGTVHDAIDGLEVGDSYPEVVLVVVGVEVDK